MDLDHVKTKLLEQKEQIERRVNAISSDLNRSEPMSQDFSEQATEQENLDVLHALEHEGKEELILINQALARLQSGEYGLCRECGEEINPARLDALPFVTTCISCAE
ncbi:TraR/DksA family transcriptional regulator [Litoribrevibacter euphylliae]|uniref:TraR/DksA family transcriptional regulator n=1 Tax=Litoribrevibacter euphylliae TaxID=1834034 RepID=A0ABV7HDP3_9GAMM